MGSLRLEVIAGKATGMSILIDDQLLVGRAADGAGRLADDDDLSRTHARFTVDADGACEVEDLNSLNGTFVNGVRIAAGPRLLNADDTIELGATTLVVRELPSPAPAQVPAPVSDRPSAAPTHEQPARQMPSGPATPDPSPTPVEPDQPPKAAAPGLQPTPEEPVPPARAAGADLPPTPDESDQQPEAAGADLAPTPDEPAGPSPSAAPDQPPPTLDRPDGSEPAESEPDQPRQLELRLTVEVRVVIDADGGAARMVVADRSGAVDLVLADGAWQVERSV